MHVVVRTQDAFSIVARSRQESDGDVVTSEGRLFHTREAATPMLTRGVGRTSSADLDTERIVAVASRRLPQSAARVPRTVELYHVTTPCIRT